MDAVSADAKAQVIATVVIGLIAVFGSIRGAILGAKFGAEATREATQQAIAADRAAAHGQRLHEDRTRIRALATECRLNAATLREEREYRPDPRYMAPLRQSALDAATAALADLPKADWEQAQPVIRDVLWFNQLIATRLPMIDQRGDTVARALVFELGEVGKRLPNQLDALAERLEVTAAGAGHDEGATRAAP
jgi:hypothetical protein